MHYFRAKAALREKNSAGAVEAYRDFLGLDAERTWDPVTLADIHLDLARLYLEQDELNAALKEVDASGSSERLPPPLVIRKESLRARILCQQHLPGPSYLTLARLQTRVPFQKWDKETKVFYLGLQYTLESAFQKAIVEAERWQRKGMWEEALASYRAALDLLNQGHYPKDRMAGALAFVLKEMAALYQTRGLDDLLLQTSETYAGRLLRQEALSADEGALLFFVGETLLRRKETSRGLAMLSASLRGQSAQSPFYGECRLLLALSLYELGYREEALPHAQAAAASASGCGHLARARLLLARLSMETSRFEEAHAALGQVEEGAPFKGEWLFLRGELAYLQRLYSEAAPLFEQALTGCPEADKETLLRHLGDCYARAFRDSGREHDARRASLQQAQEVLRALARIAPGREELPLELARLSLEAWRCFGDERERDRVHALLAKRAFARSADEAEALWLCAHAAPALEQRLGFYTLLCDERFQSTPFYDRAWFSYGQTAFALFDETGETRWLGDAQSAFARLAERCSDQSLAAEACLLGAEALALQDEANCPAALRQLEALDAADLPLSDDVRGRRDALTGALAERLFRTSRNPVYLDKARNALSRLLAASPAAWMRSEALFRLGCLHFLSGDYNQAAALFEKAAAEDPSGAFAPEALYFCAKSRMQLESDPRPIFRQLYETYPQAARAPEAYFAIYSVEEYLRGGEDALWHLKHVEKRYPQSPYAVIAAYLIAENYNLERKNATGLVLCPREPAKAGQFLAKAARLYAYLKEKELIPAAWRASLSCVCTQARLERALLFGDLAESQRELAALLQELEACSEMPLPEKTRFFEECGLGLILCQVKRGDDSAAIIAAEEMMSACHARQLGPSYYQTLALQEKARAEMRLGLFAEALTTLDVAEITGQSADALATEERLQLWIVKSECLRSLRRLDEAMLVLSNVINADAVSALRLKAMLQRAEIYELQGRPELAVRQLEALSPKGGEWGAIAQQRLLLRESHH